MDDLSIFDTNKEGFRLYYMELYNWGTFGDQSHKIYRMTPNGNNSLLTGANGSGKTTIVDALISLLVPPMRRHYNQSSGAELKKERDETSYVLGYYGKTQSEDMTSSTIQHLRTKNDYSVLLAFFYNEGLQQMVTIAQVRWFSGNELKRAYLVSPNKLNIKDHISPIDTKGEWKKRLKKIPKTEIYDSFSNYAAEFSKIFGFRSDKALNLFNQTVGIKVLGDLNEFIRANMLEEVNVEEEFVKVRENYDDLLSAHKALEKAREQVKLLEPIIENGTAFEKLEIESQEMEQTKQLVPAYFAEKHNQMLNHAITNKMTDVEAQNDRMSTLKKMMGDLHEKEISLNSAKNADDLNARVNTLEEKIRSVEDEKIRKENSYNKYVEIIKKLDLDVNPTDVAFTENVKKTKERQGKISFEISDLEAKIIEESVKLQSKHNKFYDMSDDLQSYSERKNQIPPDNIRIRQGILEALGISEEEIPFVGELLRISEDEKEWEPAIQGVLFSFGLRLLVPEKYYARVNKYINSTRLNGRIVYHKVEDKRAPNIFMDMEDGFLPSKIEIKPDTPFQDWIEGQLRHSYNYACAEGLEDFQHHRKALTKSGLRKDGDRHEKDDRKNMLSHDRFVLGWDNREKLSGIRFQLQEIDKEIKSQQHHIEQLRQRINNLHVEKDAVTRLFTFDKFSELDWQAEVFQIQQLSSEKAELLKSSNNLARLDKQLKATQKDMRERNEMYEQIISTIAHLKRDISEFERKVDENNAVLKMYEGVDLKAEFTKLMPYLEKYENTYISLEAIDETRSKMMNEVAEKLSKNIKQKSELAQSLIRQMMFYKNPSEELLKKYPGWTGDTINLEPRISYIKEYRATYERLKNDDLPKYMDRFRKYLNESIIEKLTDFKTSLENQLDDIVDNVFELNGSLRQIDFSSNPNTYIELVAKNTSDTSIRQFRIDLGEWQPDLTLYELTKDDSILEQSFLKIQSIIQRLTEDENWRRKVTDVRNWLEFSAIEYYRADNKQFKYYESSGGLSGGEKAQLSYTILGAAIAYQFGINQHGKQPKSFRFIAVDEAFSKLDPEKSHYLMALCKQLHLQLLVVTPLDKIHIVEPFISACHYVENKNKRNSVVYDLSIEEYHQKKKEFEGMVAE